MSTNPLIPRPPSQTTTPNNLFAAIDLGTNSFKLRIIHFSPTTNRFLTLQRLKLPVILTSPSSPISIPSLAIARAIHSLHEFQLILSPLHIPPPHLRLVATSAVRESANQAHFLALVHETLGFDIDVLSGYDEARLTYLGVLQFLPVFYKNVLTIDIGGGSTEFVIGYLGLVKLGVSLKLGHVTLTQRFVGKNGIDAMREYIREVVNESGLVEKVKEGGVEVCVGSSGSIRMIEKAIFMLGSRELVNEIGLFEGLRRDWKFSKDELKGLVGKVLEGESGGVVNGVFKKRAKFIVAAVILLDELFELLGIEEMEVSGYALGEGVIAEKLALVYDGFDLNANARWRSVLRLASRFNNKKRMSSATSCAAIAQVIFTGLRKWNEIDNERNEVVLLDDKDLEYLEAACLLHNIGLIMGKKGYHKRSYHIIMNGEHLHGYNTEEVKIIALLARHHRKKFLKSDHGSLSEFTDEMKHRLRVLCTIIRLSAVLKEIQSLSVPHIELSHSQEGFKLVIMDASGFPSVNDIQSIPDAIDAELKKEMIHFEKILDQKLSVVVLSSRQDDLDQSFSV